MRDALEPVDGQRERLRHAVQRQRADDACRRAIDEAFELAGVVRGRRIRLSFPAKHGIRVRTEVVDPDLAAAMRRLLELRGPRVFKYEWEDRTYNLTSKRLNDYVKIYMGDDRRFPTAAFTRRGCARCGSLAGRTSDAELAALVANSTCTRGCIARLEFL